MDLPSWIQIHQILLKLNNNWHTISTLYVANERNMEMSLVKAELTYTKVVKCKVDNSYTGLKNVILTAYSNKNTTCCLYPMNVQDWTLITVTVVNYIY